MNDFFLYAFFDAGFKLAPPVSGRSLLSPLRHCGNLAVFEVLPKAFSLQYGALDERRQSDIIVRRGEIEDPEARNLLLVHRGLNHPVGSTIQHRRVSAIRISLLPVLGRTVVAAR